MRVIEKIEIHSYEIEVGDDDIVYARVKDNATVGLKDVKELTELLIKITPDRTRPLLVDLAKIKYITKEARDYFKGNDRIPTAPAVALITQSQLGNILANFYIGIRKPIVPTQLFTNKKNAVLWLKKFL